MRNLVLALSILMCSAPLLLYQRRSLAAGREHGAELQVKNSTLDATTEALRTAIDDLARRRGELSTQLARLTNELEGAKSVHRPDPVPLDPRHEGNWPSHRPYFYLPKEHIPTLSYGALNAAARVSEEAAALFGMTAQERRAIDQAITGAFRKLLTEESRSAFLTNTPANLVNRPGKTKISVYIPPVETADQVKAELIQAFSTILGSERSALFIERAQEMQSNFDNFSAEPRTITLIPKDATSGELIISTRGGSMFNYYDRSLEMNWLRVQYDHILDRFLPAE